MQLGDEVIELIQHLTPQGKPVPIDSRSNDLWFQHPSDRSAGYRTSLSKLRPFNFCLREVPRLVGGSSRKRRMYVYQIDTFSITIFIKTLFTNGLSCCTIFLYVNSSAGRMRPRRG